MILLILLIGRIKSKIFKAIGAFGNDLSEQCSHLGNLSDSVNFLRHLVGDGAGQGSLEGNKVPEWTPK